MCEAGQSWPWRWGLSGDLDTSPSNWGKVLIVAPKKGSGLENYLGGQTQTSSVVSPRKGDLLHSLAQRLPCRWWRWAWAVRATA